MMIDSTLEFCDATALDTGAAGRYRIGSTYDLGADPGDIGNGNPLYLVIIVTTAITAVGSGGLDMWLASDAAATFTADGNTSVHMVAHISTSTTAIPVGSVLMCAASAAEGMSYEQHLGIVMTSITSAITAGAVNAFLTPTPQKWVANPDGTPTP